MPSASCSASRLAIAPTIVTSSPSRIHTVPSPSTTSQCQPLHGSRSIRAGIRVSTVSALMVRGVSGYAQGETARGTPSSPAPPAVRRSREAHARRRYGRGMRRALAALALVAAGCGGSHPAAPKAAPAAREAPAARAVATPVPRLSGGRRCPDARGATCSVLRVPLDRSGRVKGTLALRVAVSGPAGAPVVVVLSGGPGEPGEPFHARAREWLRAPPPPPRRPAPPPRRPGRPGPRRPA